MRKERALAGCGPGRALVHLSYMNRAAYFYWYYFFGPAKLAEGLGAR